MAVLLGLGTVGLAREGPIRVPCLGNSVTYGAGLVNTHPERLRVLLGDQCEARSFGVSAATILNRGDVAYRNQQAFIDVVEFGPTRIVITSGTNDSKTHNCLYEDELYQVAFRKEIYRSLDQL